jgi:predicted ATP-dependent protease
VLVEVPPEALRLTTEARGVPCAATGEVPPLPGIIGQPRAIQALELGLAIEDPTFHVFAAGPSGTGRTTAVRLYLERIARERERPSDWCYVNNFRDPFRPRALRLPPGHGRVLRDDMAELVRRARHDVPSAFESDAYVERRQAIEAGLEGEREALLHAMGQAADRAGFALRPTPAGLLIVPLKDGVPLEEDGFLRLSVEERAEIRTRRAGLEDVVAGTMKQVRERERQAERRREALDREVALFVVGGLLDDLAEKHRGVAGIAEYLAEVREDVVKNLAAFRGETEGPPTPLGIPGAEEHVFRAYEVNVLVDQTDRRGAPVVTELHPSYPNVFGRIERVHALGALTTHFTLLRAGALHHANGGYLVLPVEDVLRHPFVWDGLKRALVNREALLEDVAENTAQISAQSLRPQPIPLATRVVLVGTAEVHALLQHVDDDFRELFKVKAHFDDRMERSPSNVMNFVSFLCDLCQREGLPPLDAAAAARMVEHAARLAADQQMLSTRFSTIADVVREAAHYAREKGADHVGRDDVEGAIRAAVHRVNLVEQRLREMVTRGVIRIETRGTAVGQVNGLSVWGVGDHAFGHAARITASHGLGREGVVDIEREVELGGPVHSKGVLILAGFLADRYARSVPLSLSARLVFEQSYGGVEGDSASSAELYALLSSLAGLPLRQDVAVTGSVDQRGRIQPVGGINEKVEGFFDLCRERGLAGTEGVLIPPQNVQHLMLREDVVGAVRAGQFHLWTAETVDDGIEHLSATPASEVDARVSAQLADLAARWRAFAVPGEA